MSVSPVVDPKEWCERYGIEPPDVPCPKCSAKLRFETPVAIAGYRGLLAKACECGFESGAFTVVPFGKGERDFWESLRPAWASLLKGES